MKKLILLILAILFISPLCFAKSVQDAHKAMIGRLNAAGAAPTYLLHEDWESGSATFGGDADNMYVWIEDRAGSGADADYKAVILEGAESAEFDDSRYYYTFAGTDSKIYAAIVGSFDGVSCYPVVLRRADDASIVNIELDWDGGETKFRARIWYDGDENGGCESFGTASAYLFSANTAYYFKLEYDNGTDGDGTIQFYYSADPFSSWTNVAAMDVADGPNAQAAQIELAAPNSNQAIFDDIRIDDENITY